MGRQVIAAYRCSGCGKDVQFNCRVRNGTLVLRCDTCKVDFNLQPARCCHCGSEASYVRTKRYTTGFDFGQSGWYRCYCTDCTFNRLAKKQAIPQHPVIFVAVMTVCGPFFFIGPIVAFIAALRGPDGDLLKALAVCGTMSLAGLGAMVAAVFEFKNLARDTAERRSVIAALNDPTTTSEEKLARYFRIDASQPLPDATIPVNRDSLYPSRQRSSSN